MVVNTKEEERINSDGRGELLKWFSALIHIDFDFRNPLHERKGSYLLNLLLILRISCHLLLTIVDS